MSGELRLWLDGIGAWTPGLADWPAWRALLRGDGTLDATAPARPRPARLAAGERRRVSTHVLGAVEVADQAVAMSAHDCADMPCVFASAHGDVGIMDYLCATLADTPQHISPTRFHNSVHNAAAGYWTIAAQCHAASQAVAAYESSFAAGLLEAATQALADDQCVLLVAHDEPGVGPLEEVFASERSFACALVLSPHAGDASLARLDLSLAEGTARADMPRHTFAAQLARANPAARALSLLEALADDARGRVTLAAAPELGLVVDVQAAD